ncbi:hypothetical protein DPMN_042291 [Dreissena polymorpha]|uniref:Uncharacterized protein n=1 Tax=Dreissena polymorpha TaxID=45954 RepID=A0A9D4D0T2_DREPO|nr:hypothetical protein DPMN_042291 [Dreissena polymorpha]
MLMKLHGQLSADIKSINSPVLWGKYTENHLNQSCPSPRDTSFQNLDDCMNVWFDNCGCESAFKLSALD